ncbi:MAG: hypothetical protein KatS3mg108_1119 [Isosphaeraceae bacterium]|jgi:hypothetical protein|nr:MAG: hypothetical protein KatS3mg108_1119 [Isosphaeraceae bacterium]
MATKDRELPPHLTKDAAAPVIHHEADETLLARWLKGLWSKGPAGWLPWVAGLAVVAVAVTAVAAFFGRPPAGQDAWSDLIVPPSTLPESVSGYEKFPARVRPLLAVADRYATTPAARWARLRAALTLYEEGLRDLPNRKEVGRPLLEEAIKLFDQVLAEAPPDSPEAQLAALSKARAYEARGELDQAIELYEQFASKWPTSPDAPAASQRAARLQTPEVRDFYEKFYTLDFSTAGSTGGGLDPGSILNLPGIRSGSESSRFGEPALPPLGNVPAQSATPAEAIPSSPSPASELPADPFAAPVLTPPAESSNLPTEPPSASAPAAESPEAQAASSPTP